MSWKDRAKKVSTETTQNSDWKSRATVVEPKQVPQERSMFEGSLPEIASKIVQKGAQYPMGMTADPRNIVGAMKGGMSDIYYELTPQLEKGAEVVGESVRRSLPPSANIPAIDLVRNPIGSAMTTLKEFPQDLTKAVSMVYPPRPVAAMLSAEGAVAPSIKVPMSTGLMSPKISQKGITSSLRSMGEEGLTPATIGQTARRELPTPSIEQTSRQLYKEPISTEMAGETIKGAVNRKIAKAKQIEQEAWKNLEPYKDVEAGTPENAIKVAREAMKEAGANERELPQVLKDMDLVNSLMRSGATKDQAIQTLKESLGVKTEGYKLDILRDPRVSKVADLLSDLERPDLTFNDLKLITTKVGNMIDYNAPRGDNVNRLLKNIRTALGEDKLAVGKKGGFENLVKDANKSTVDVYDILEKRPSRVVRKADYSSEVEAKLIKRKTPEAIDELLSTYEMTPDEIGKVRRSVLDQIAEDSGGDPIKTRKALLKYNKTVREKLFGEKNDLIDNIIKEGSDDGQKLRKFVEKGEPSELIDNLVNDGTEETAKLVANSFGEETVNSIKKGIVNKVLSPHITKTAKEQVLDLAGVATDLNKMNPEFIKATFGKDAKKMLALRDATKTFVESKKDAKIRFSWEGAGTGAAVGFVIGGFPGAAIGATAGKVAPILNQIVKQYRISRNILKMVGKEYGEGIAKEILPNIKGKKYMDIKPGAGMAVSLPEVKRRSEQN